MIGKNETSCCCLYGSHIFLIGRVRKPIDALTVEQYYYFATVTSVSLGGEKSVQVLIGVDWSPCLKVT